MSPCVSNEDGLISMFVAYEEELQLNKVAQDYPKYWNGTKKYESMIRTSVYDL